MSEDGSTQGLGDEVRKAVLSRLSSPLLGSFIVSWMLCNYRIVLVILSGETIKYKFKFIDEQVGPFWEFVSGSGFLWPLGVTLVYFFGAPVLRLLALRWDRLIKRHEKSDAQRSEGLELLTQAQSVQYRGDIDRLEQKVIGLRQDVANTKGALLGWKAASLAKEASPAIESALSDFLTSQLFLMHDNTRISQPLARMVFKISGALEVDIVIAPNLRFIPKRWGIRGSTVDLFDNDTSKVGELNFDPASGDLIGMLGQEYVRIKGAAFVAYEVT